MNSGSGSLLFVKDSTKFRYSTILTTFFLKGTQIFQEDPDPAV
jgi:hypothetical protein